MEHFPDVKHVQDFQQLRILVAVATLVLLSNDGGIDYDVSITVTWQVYSFIFN